MPLLVSVMELLAKKVIPLQEATPPRLSEPNIILELVVNNGLPVQPEQSILAPNLGISPLMVLPATKALGITTGSCGRGTRVVHPCVDQVNDAVPVAV